MAVALAIPSEGVSAPQTVPSPLLWGVGSHPHGKGFPKGNIIMNPLGKIGHFTVLDFLDIPKVLTNTASFAGGWNTYLADGATIVDAGIANVNAATFASDAADESIAFAKMFGGVRITRNSGRCVYFETRVKLSSIATTTASAFFGLFDMLLPAAASHLSTAGAIPDRNYIGFYKAETTTMDTLAFVYRNSGQTAATPLAIHTLVADAFVKVGFAFDGKETLSVFANGQEVVAARLGATPIAAVTFPNDINLAPAFSLMTAATTTTMTMNWLAFGYTNNAGDGYP